MNNKIKELLRKRNISQWELAIKLGISENTMYRKLRVPITKSEYDKLVEVIESRNKEANNESFIHNQ